MSTRNHKEAPTPRDIGVWMDDIWNEHQAHAFIAINRASSVRTGELLLTAGATHEREGGIGASILVRHRTVRNGRNQDLWAMIYGLLIEVAKALDEVRELRSREEQGELPF